jgi:hypothetical protein
LRGRRAEAPFVFLAPGAPLLDYRISFSSFFWPPWISKM